MRDTVLKIVQQVSGELGIPRPTALASALDTSTQQLLSLLNAAGYELTLYYPWEELKLEWQQTTAPGDDKYPLPAGFGYFLDQTQWDRTNRWPLMGPKSSQEWQWLKGGLLASGPRTRYRMIGDQFQIHPVPTSALDLRAEYISSLWLEKDPAGSAIYYSVVNNDSDIPRLDFWLLVKYLKYKFWAAKGFDTTSYRDDFLMVFDALTGKNAGAPMLSLSPKQTPMLVGYHSIPDGSWNTGA